MFAMQFSEHLRSLREQRGFSKADLARQMSISLNYLVEVEAGRKKPPTFERCQQIAQVLELSESERAKLIELATLERASKESRPIVEEYYRMAGAVKERDKIIERIAPAASQTRKLYLLGSVPAGPIEPAADYVEGTVIVDYSVTGNKDCFALRVKGNCLEDKGVFNGDIVIVAKDMQLENGNIAVVRIHDHDGEKVTMKIWKKTGEQIILMPATHHGDAEPIIITKQDNKKVEIIGKVIYANKDFR